MCSRISSRTGVYDRRRPLLKTTSPSMDILVSSNLERLLYLLSAGTPRCVAGLMNAAEPGGTSISVSAPAAGTACRRSSTAPAATMPGRAEVIGRLWQEQHYLCDPHTGGGVVWRQSRLRLEDRGSGGGAVHGLTLQVPRRRCWGRWRAAATATSSP